MPNIANVYLNATMLSDPIFEKDYITIPIDGSISMKNPSDKQDKTDLQTNKAQYQNMPVFIGNKTENVQVQLFISEHVLNSALYMLHTRDLMK